MSRLQMADCGLQIEEAKLVVLPTHHCFDDAAEFIEGMARRQDARFFQCKLVHGICLHPDDGRQFAHAWVELDGVAIERGILNGAVVELGWPVAEYHARLRVQDFTAYSMRQAWLENQRTGNVGPWEERYRALCGKDAA